MKLEIYNNSEKPEPVLRLTLRECGNGGIELIAVDACGKFVQNLLFIDRSGAIYRRHLDEDFIKAYGLSVDDSHRLRVS